MSRKVQWKSGYSCPVSCEVVVQRLEHIRSQSDDGRIDPAKVVDDARPKNALLHGAFTWNDKEAAELHRQDQARRMIRSVEIVRVAYDGAKSKEIAYVSIASPFQEGTGGYKPTSEAMEDPSSREIVLGTAWAVLKGFEKRFGRLTEFAEIIAAIKRAEQATTEAAREAVA